MNSPTIPQLAQFLEFTLARHKKKDDHEICWNAQPEQLQLAAEAFRLLEQLHDDGILNGHDEWFEEVE